MLDESYDFSMEAVTRTKHEKCLIPSSHLFYIIFFIERNKIEQYWFVPLIRRLQFCTNLQFNYIEIFDEQKKKKFPKERSDRRPKAVNI